MVYYIFDEHISSYNLRARELFYYKVYWAARRAAMRGQALVH